MKIHSLFLLCSFLYLTACNGGQEKTDQSTQSDSTSTEEAAMVDTTLTISLQKRPLGEPVDATITYSDDRHFTFLSDSLAPVNFPTTPLYIKLAEDQAGNPVVTHAVQIPFDSIQHNATTLRITSAAELEVHILVQDAGNPNRFDLARKKKARLDAADEQTTEEGDSK